MGFIPIAFGAAAVGSAVYGVDQEKAAARDETRARDTQRRIQKIKHNREKRKQAQNAIRARAAAEASAAATGTSNTSMVSGTTSSISSQVASNLSFLDQIQGLTEKQSIFQQKAANHSTNAGVASAASNLLFQGASASASASAKG